MVRARWHAQPVREPRKIRGRRGEGFAAGRRATNFAVPDRIPLLRDQVDADVP